MALEPFAPWHLVVGLLAGLSVLLILARGPIDRWASLGRRPVTRAAVLAASLLAALLFAAAAFNPYFARRGSADRGYLIVVADVSDSLLRAPGGWPDYRDRIREHLLGGVHATPASVRATARAGIVTFGDGAVVPSEGVPLNRLPATFATLADQDLAPGGQTDIASALSRAGRLIEDAGGSGAILLISDGNQTRGDALAEATRLARQGVPISVLAVESGPPELAITAADLPRQVSSGAETHVRGVLRNSAALPVQGLLSLARNADLPDDAGHFGLALGADLRVSIDGWVRLRQSLRFDGYGLQFIDLALTPANGAGEHKRRFFTHVNRPPEILSVGEDTRWESCFPEETATITRVAPEDLLQKVDPGEYDAIVLSAVPAFRLSRAALTAIAEAVTIDGVGLMLLNGDHAGRADDSETVLMSYNETELAPLLPVHGGPRPYQPEPPPRQVVILLDTSGSMAGQRIHKSKEIVRYIISSLMRPQDRLDLITFTQGVGHLVQDRYMDDQGKRLALDMLAGVTAGGGTDPRAALQLIARRKLMDCGLIFISDGEFGQITYRPECRATVFAIGKTSVPPTSPLWALADPFPVGPLFNPASIRIPYFEGEPRERFYEFDRFKPLRIERFQANPLPMPDLYLNGSAVSYLKAESDLVGVRPKLTDPVLAYGEAGFGTAGVFTSGIPGDWLTRREGREAIYRWFTEVIAYTARDRYDFNLVDRGETMEITLALVTKEGHIPTVDQVTATIEIPGDQAIGVPLLADPLIPATFKGRVRIPRTEETRRAKLTVRETGAEALSKPQRIPMLIPAEGLVSRQLTNEAYSYGRNEPLLQDIAQIGGGLYDPAPDMPLLRKQSFEIRGDPLWPGLLVAALLCYIAAFVLRRLDP